MHCGLPQMFQPVQRWVGGIYTPNLITSFLKCPSGPHEGQKITSGVFGNFPRLDSPTWILLLGLHVSWPSVDLRRPSVVVLDRLRVAPPSSFAALESSPAPEGSRHDLREHDPEWSLKPPGSIVCGGPQRRLSTSFERLRLFSSVTFALPEAPRRLGHHLRTPDLGELVDASYLR